MNASARIDCRFLEHPAFSVFDQQVRARLAALTEFPAPGELRELTRGISCALTPWFDFAAQDDAELEAAGGFDRLIAQASRIPTRVASYHDLLGALVWLHFPALKTAIHRTQLAGSVWLRGPVENAATHLDESGVLVLSAEPALFESLAALQWREVFWDQRAELTQSSRFLGFGHGLLDSLREPHPRLMGKALFVRIRVEHLALSNSELRVLVDGALAKCLPAFLTEPACLQPLPVLGVPGWSAQQSGEFYQDTCYFRSQRARSRPPRAPAYIDLDEDCR